jgi:hypothetical protein
MVDRCRSQPTARQLQGRAKVPPAGWPYRLDSEPPTGRQQLDSSNERRGWRRWGGKAALVAGGLLVGGVPAGTLTAGAATTTTAAADPDAATAPGAAPGGGAVDESESQRPDEHLLTGDTASKVRAAALARYPGATVLRVESDADGVDEAHLTTTDGQRVTVEVGKDFTVTGLESSSMTRRRDAVPPA